VDTQPEPEVLRGMASLVESGRGRIALLAELLAVVVEMAGCLTLALGRESTSRRARTSMLVMEGILMWRSPGETSHVLSRVAAF